MVISPEIDDSLCSCIRCVEQAGGRLLGPGRAVAELAGDKQATAEYLLRAGVPVPAGCLLAHLTQRQLSPPLVIKPRDGAGSQGVRMLTEPTAASDLIGGSNSQSPAIRGDGGSKNFDEACLQA